MVDSSHKKIESVKIDHPHGFEIHITQEDGDLDSPPKYNIDINFFEFAKKLGATAKNQKPSIEAAERAARQELENALSQLKGLYIDCTDRKVPIDYSADFTTKEAHDHLWIHSSVIPAFGDGSIREIAREICTALGMFKPIKPFQQDQKPTSKRF